jgi:hypothetical protein
VRRWLRGRPRRPGLTNPPRDGEAWATFCQDVIGVDPADLRRDRSLFVCTRGRVFRCKDPQAGDGAWLEVPDDAAAVGAIVVEQLLRTPLAPPIVASRPASVSEAGEPSSGPSTESGFGPKTAWLAVSAVAADDLVAALGLVDTLPIDATDGIAWALGEGVVVLPPIDGWTLAAGHDLAVDVELDVAGLSRRLGTVVQAFRTHRVVDVHEWTWAEGGAVRRSAEFQAGRDPEWVTIGEPTPGEADVGPDPPTEDDVFSVAGEWSIDPTRLPLMRDADAIWGRLP